MKKVVERERNKIYYRVLHLPVWIWVFFVLPGRLTHDLYSHGPDRRHGIWLLLVTIGCVWRGIAGRLPGVETQPYVTHFGVHQPNLWYRVVCYTAAWIDLLVPFTLNFLGLVLAAIRAMRIEVVRQPAGQHKEDPDPHRQVQHPVIDFVALALDDFLH